VEKAFAADNRQYEEKQLKLTPKVIKKIRLDLGRTQKNMATILGTTSVTVSRWELGHSKPMPVFQAKLVKLYNMNNNPKPEQGVQP
jgi:DNA-binding transcriptional regulator YiaG